MTYERNNTMVACVIAFIIVGGVALGALFMLGSMNFPNWNGPSHWSWDWDDTDGTLYEFERTGVAIPDEITLHINVSVGGIMVTYLDDPQLTYEISIWAPNDTIEDVGAPTVVWSSDTISIDYPVAGVNVTLGTNATYTLDLLMTTGGIFIDLDHGARVGNIEAVATTGGISLQMTDDVIISGDVEFELTTTTGGVSVEVDLPTGVGGYFSGATTVGGVDVTPVGWDPATAGSTQRYQTPDYETAADTVTITATTTTGGISATLS